MILAIKTTILTKPFLASRRKGIEVVPGKHGLWTYGREWKVGI